MIYEQILCEGLRNIDRNKSRRFVLLKQGFLAQSTENYLEL